MSMSPTAISGDALLAQLRGFVGAENVLTDPRANRRFRKGYRYGEGKVLAVVRPGTLVEQWRAFKACIEAGRVVILNAANTGLNGGSTPFGDDYDREVVVINTMRISRIDLLKGGEQVVALAGSTLDSLERLIRPLGREPHSVIGSSTIGASIVGGVCNNSGGALIRRGPAFTQLALYARVAEDGSVSLINHLGIDLGNDPETILARLDRGEYTETDVSDSTGRLASDPDYGNIVRDIDAPTPARFNNDPRLLFEAAGSAGKLCVFAVRLDTFASSGPSKVFYIGTNDYLELTNLRRHIFSTFTTTPVAGEYIQRGAYELAEEYGKDVFLFLKHVGSQWISKAFSLKSKFDVVSGKLGLGTNLSDKLLQLIVGILPNHLPKRMNAFRDRFEHHLLLRMDGGGIEEARRHLKAIFPSANGDFFECDDEEAAAAFRHRYAVGAATLRFRLTHPNEVENIVALDMAVPRNTIDWRETLPEGIEEQIVRRIPCGHFLCQVFHYEYAVKKGANWMDIEHKIIEHLSGRGIEFPSEHNVGHLYTAKPVLADFYRSLDPTNSLNPGLGHTSKRRNWQ